MRTYENKNFKVTVNKNHVAIENKKFGDMYYARIENGKLVAQTSLALKYAMNLRVEFGF